MWDGLQGYLLRTLAGHTDQVWGCAISGDGKVIASASDDGTVGVWDPAVAEAIRNPAGPPRPSASLPR